MDFAVWNFARVLAVGATGLLYGCVTSAGLSTASAGPASDRVTVIRVMGNIGNPLIEGGHLLRAGRVSEALRLFKQADESGDVLASMPLVREPSGDLRVGNVNVTAGLDEAAEAREGIGEVFEHAGNYSAAASWYEKAVDGPGFGLGHDEAAANLAYLYLKGKGVPQNRSRARELLGTASGGDGEKYVELFDNGLLPPTADDLSGSYADRVLATINQRSLDGASAEGTPQGEIDEGRLQSGTTEKTLQPEKVLGLVFMRYLVRKQANDSMVVAMFKQRKRSNLDASIENEIENGVNARFSGENSILRIAIATGIENICDGHPSIMEIAQKTASKELLRLIEKQSPVDAAKQDVSELLDAFAEALNSPLFRHWLASVIDETKEGPDKRDSDNQLGGVSSSSDAPATPNPSPTATTANPGATTLPAWPDGRVITHPEHAVETYVVKVARNDTLQIRAGCGTRFAAVASIPPDATDVTAYDQDKIWDGDTWWYPVEWHGYRGYVGRSHLLIP